MSFLSVCLELDFSDNYFSDDSALEKNYQSLIKPLLSFLFSHPKCYLSIFFTEQQLLFFKDFHPEALELLSELTGRKQVEILGGACYSSILPLLFSSDRSGQIERLSGLLRSSLGKRPRGSVLYGSFWDPSLLLTLQSCGMEYVFINSSLVPVENKNYNPLIMSDQGKSIKILPLYEDKIPLESETFSDWLKRLNCSDSNVISVRLDAKNMDLFLHNNFLDQIGQLDTNIIFTTPQKYIKTAYNFIQVYIPAGMDKCILQDAKIPCKKTKGKNVFPLTIYDFMNIYPQVKKLYDRMMYVSLIISQLQGGDRMRKKSAKEKLWQAQSGEYYVSMPLGLPPSSEKLKCAYKLLCEAEQLLKESYEFNNAVTAYDYDGDGLKDYICRMTNFHAVISPEAAQITELDIITRGINYIPAIKSDSYDKGIFTEYLIEKSSFYTFLKDSRVASNKEKICDFSNIIFSEKKFDTKKKEIQLEGKNHFSPLDITVSLRKNYTAYSDGNGIAVQYILKNESPFHLHAIFATEINLSEINISQVQDVNQYKNEVIYNGNKKELSTDTSLNLDSGVSLLQISDNINKVILLFEPNENAGLHLSTTLVNNDKCKTIVFFWEIDISSDHSMEKIINFSILPTKD